MNALRCLWTPRYPITQRTGASGISARFGAKLFKQVPQVPWQYVCAVPDEATRFRQRDRGRLVIDLKLHRRLGACAVPSVEGFDCFALRVPGSATSMHDARLQDR